MARITSQRAVTASGGNRYMLVLMAAQRTKELINGSKPRIENAHRHSKGIVALKEIEQGLYTRKEFLETLPKPQKKKGYRDEYFPT
jgi:DNA-directed RNA polymerase omega subunit